MPGTMTITMIEDNIETKVGLTGDLGITCNTVEQLVDKYNMYHRIYILNEFLINSYRCTVWHRSSFTGENETKVGTKTDADNKWSVSKIKDDDAITMTMFYTGLPSFPGFFCGCLSMFP